MKKRKTIVATGLSGNKYYLQDYDISPEPSFYLRTEPEKPLIKSRHFDKYALFQALAVGECEVVDKFMTDFCDVPLSKLVDLFEEVEI